MARPGKPALVYGTLVAAAANADEVVATAATLIDAAPLFRLALTPDLGPVTPGQSLGYTLYVSKTGDVSATGATLSMPPVPAGTAFTSASGGGTLADGMVTWDIGTLAPGEDGAVRFVVEVDPGLPDGSAVLAQAKLDEGSVLESPVAASAVTPVQALPSLRLAYGVSGSSVRPY